ncbi:MAG: cupin domain-containing protein [Alphaproteobacteria bacterium]|nr:cupin domain-containing protein [Alphaproteobacteria bacterium]
MLDHKILKIISFKDLNPVAEEATPKKILKGTPKTTTYNYYTDQTEQFYSGIWESTVGLWEINYETNEHEFCHIIEGSGIITGDNKYHYAFKAGDSFIIPPGFKGTWETLSTLKKYYAIFVSK